MKAAIHDEGMLVPVKPKLDVSLRWKVTGLITLSMLAVLSISTTLGYIRQRQRSLANMSLLASQTGQIIEHALERDMLMSDFERIQATFDSIANDNRVRTLFLLDMEGNVVFAPKEDGVGQQLDNQDETCQPCHQYSPAERPSGILAELEDGQNVFRSMHPIENRPPCTRCHDSNQPLIGLLLTDLSIEPVETAIALELRENIIWLAGTVITTALLSSFAVNRWVLERLSRLAAAMENIGLRALAERLPENPRDEIGRLSAAFNIMTNRLQRRDDQNKKLTDALERRAEERGMLLRQLLTAQEEERIRVARELHDELGQTLSSTALTVELSQRSLAQDNNPEIISTYLESAHAQIAEATDRMYDLILGLRPSVLDDIGLVAAIRTLAQQILEPAQLTYEIKAHGLESRLPPEIETALFRIFQEAMSNVQKHAQAKHVRLLVKLDADRVVAQISDDGRGIVTQTSQSDSGHRGLGLLGIRERAAQLGGTLTIDSEADSGTTISVQLPLYGGADA